MSFKLTLKSPISHTSTDTDLFASSQKLDIQLPKAYQDFVKEYGYGLTCGLFIIYSPLGKHDGLFSRSNTLKQELIDSVQSGFIYYQPDGSPELVQRLAPFGYSENADILAWDPKSPSEPGEYWIYLIGSRKFEVRKVVANLTEFLEKAIKPGISGMLGQADFQLEPTFEPWAIH